MTKIIIKEKINGLILFGSRNPLFKSILPESKRGTVCQSVRLVTIGTKNQRLNAVGMKPISFAGALCRYRIASDVPHSTTSGSIRV